MTLEIVAALIICLPLWGFITVVLDVLRSPIRNLLSDQPDHQQEAEWKSKALTLLVSTALTIALAWTTIHFLNVRDSEAYSELKALLTPRCEAGMEIRSGDQCSHPVLGRFSVNEKGQGILEGSPHGPSDKSIKVDWEVDHRVYGFQARRQAAFGMGGTATWSIALAGLWARLGVCTNDMTVGPGQSCLWERSEFRVYAVDQLYPWDRRQLQKRGYSVLWWAPHCSALDGHDFEERPDDSRGVVLDGDEIAGYYLFSDGWARFFAARYANSGRWVISIDAKVLPTDLPEQCRAIRTHRVKTGDTLSDIARAENVALDALARYNGIEDPDKISSWVLIYVPPAEWQPPVR